MIKELFYQLKYMVTQMLLNPKKDFHQRLQESFGKQKQGTFDFESIEKYHVHKDQSNAYQVLSDKTCNDLDFDDLFMLVDRTHSCVGQQYLYNQLRVIPKNTQNTALNEEIIDSLVNDSELRISIQKKLEKLSHKDAYYISSLFQEEHINPPKWFGAIKALAILSLILSILSFFKSIFLIILVGVFCVNIVIHYWNKSNLIQYVNSIPQLLTLNSIASGLFTNPILKKLNPNLSESFKLVNKVKSRMSFFSIETKLQGDFEVIVWFAFEIFKTLFLLEPLILFNVLRRLDKKRDEIESVFEFVGRIDTLVSIASLRNGLEIFCLPSITDVNKIIAQEIQHPLISNCTSNSIEITEKSILLTGSNMSGKTSFIRAIGLNIITGLTINTCFAKRLTFPLIKVFSAIRINDDLLNNKSYYFEEVLTIKQMLEESENGNRNLFLLDEIFKGTNTVERISAGKSVLSALANNNNKILVSTHDIELTDMLEKQYELYHFSENVENNSVGFDYKLKEGKLTNRNALRILEINNYPKQVVQEAVAIAKEIDELYLSKHSHFTNI